MRSAAGVTVVSALVLACSHKKEYVAAQDAYQSDLGDIATYATLLDETTYGDADTRVVVPGAASYGMMRICTLAQTRTMGDEPKVDAEKQIVAALRAAFEGCCTNATPKSCLTGMSKESAMLAKLDGDATKAGLPAGALAPTHGTAKVRDEVDAIRAATKPTPEESKLMKLWTDPSATRGALEAACDAASKSDPKKEAPIFDGPSSTALARAGDTSMRCLDLKIYTGVEDMDAMFPHDLSRDAELCSQATEKHDVALPTSMVEKHAAIVKDRCHLQIRSLHL